MNCKDMPCNVRTTLTTKQMDLIVYMQTFLSKSFFSPLKQDNMINGKIHKVFLECTNCVVLLNITENKSAWQTDLIWSVQNDNDQVKPCANCVVLLNITENKQKCVTDLVWSVQHDEDKVKPRQQCTAHPEQIKIAWQWFLCSSKPAKHHKRIKGNPLFLIRSSHSSYRVQYSVVTTVHPLWNPNNVFFCQSALN